MSITEHTIKTQRHTTSYLAAGPDDGPLVIFVHGWPELSISWRHQLPALAALGFRAVAPDMRGYGRSAVYQNHGDYAQEHIVRDMIEVIDAVGREKAVWVGHDWGSPVVWNLASHHPDRCHAVANTPEQFTLLSLAEKLSSMMTVEYLEERARRAKLERFEQLLAKVPDVEPEESDRL